MSHKITKLLIVLLTLTMIAGCKSSEILAPEPSALDLDKNVPSCPGIQSLAVTSGPSITVTWAQAADNLSEASKISYYIYMRKSSESYDLVSPSKIVVGSTTAIVTNGISIGPSYTLFVSCRDEAGNVFPTGPMNERSIAIADVLAPTPITDLTINNIQMQSLTLLWSPSDDGAGGTSAGAMVYKVYASLSSPVSTSGIPLATVTGATSFSHLGLNPRERWYYRVVALDQTGNRSADSNERDAETLDDTELPTFPLGTNINMTGQSTTSLTINWSQGQDNVTLPAGLTYRLYRCSGSSVCNPFAGTLVTTTAPGVTTFTDSGLTPSMLYNYGVRVRDYRGNMSSNFDKLQTSTTFSSTGRFYAYPTLKEVGTRLGADVVVGNVVGAASGAGAYPDLIVGAPNASQSFARYRVTGCIYIFAGTGIGQFGQTPIKTICDPLPTQNGGATTQFGYALALGDFDADAVKDLAVSDLSRGRVYFFKVTNTAGTLDVAVSPMAPPMTGTAGSFGAGICVGDFEGNPANGVDFAITSPNDNCTAGCGAVTGSGTTYFYRNVSTSGNFASPTAGSYSAAINMTVDLNANGYAITTNERTSRRCTVGNFNPNDTTRMYVAVGTGLTNPTATVSNDGVIAFYQVTPGTTPTFAYKGYSASIIGASYQWGESLTAIQLDNGAHELAVGAPNDGSVGAAAGGVYLYRTTADGSGNITLNDEGISFYGGRDFDSNSAGSGVFAADIWGHGNGRQDLVYGAAADDKSNTLGANAIDVGDVYVHRNTSGVLSTAIAQNDFDISNATANTGQEFGHAICVGDVNNDTVPDVMLGSRLQDYDATSLVTRRDIGAVYVYYGVGVGEIDFKTPSQILYGPGDQQDAYFGSSCVVMDQNNDGKKDLLVGSYNRNVGGTAGRGIVYVYHGAGFSPLPSSNSAAINNPVVTGSWFGFSLAKGDINADGLDDLVVGAPNFNNTGALAPLLNGIGRTYVYWNSVSGISAASRTEVLPPHGAAGATPGTGHSGATYLANNHNVIAANFYFGYSVATFSTRAGAGVDLISCAPNADTNAGDLYNSPGNSPAATDHGLCFIFEGKTNSGVNPMQLTAANEFRHLDNAAANIPANFGSAMTVGKWDGDLVDDLVICAMRARNSSNVDNVGGCYAYLGSPGGGFQGTTTYRPSLHTSPNERYSPATTKVIYNPNIEASISYFGRAVGLVDINNNSSSDLLIGEPASDAQDPLDSEVRPATMGTDSGRVYIQRGAFP